MKDVEIGLECSMPCREVALTLAFAQQPCYAFSALSPIPQSHDSYETISYALAASGSCIDAYRSNAQKRLQGHRYVSMCATETTICNNERRSKERNSFAYSPLALAHATRRTLSCFVCRSLDDHITPASKTAERDAHAPRYFPAMRSHTVTLAA